MVLMVAYGSRVTRREEQSFKMEIMTMTIR